MKIVNIIGGLGNQMFQYAFAVALKKEHPDEVVKIDTQHFRFPFMKKYKGNNFYHNGFEIYKIFPNADIPVATAKDLFRITYFIPNYIFSRVVRKILPNRRTEYVTPLSNYFAFDEYAFRRKGDCYYEGMWASVKYFENVRDELISQFSFGNPNEYNRQMCELIQSSNSVAIHIRRGDYVNATNFKGICTLNYYKEAIETILQLEKDCVFYIFSNDLDWCKKEIEPLMGNSRIEYVSGNQGKDSAWDMYLMGKCKSQIIANSSFSWWSAFLNKEAKHIIVPSRWINRTNNVDIYEHSWIKINV